MKHSIFISYRREDTHDGSRLLCNALTERYGDGAVFFDNRSIDIGDDWPAEIESALNDAKVVLVVIGKHWFDGDPDFNIKRIDNENDWVHREVGTTLESKQITTMPVLLNIKQPPEVAFPPPIRALSKKQAFPIRRDYQEDDTSTLIKKIDNLLPDLVQAAQKKTSARENAQPNSANSDEFDANTYRKTLAIKTQDIRLLGATNAQFSLPSSLPRVYVPVMTQGNRRELAGEFDENQDEDVERLKEGSRLVTVMSALHEESLLLSGNPGSGKSTFAQWLVHCVCEGAVPGEAILGEQSDERESDAIDYEEKLSDGLLGKLPVWIPLREFWRDMPHNGGNCEWQSVALEQMLSQWLAHRDPPLPEQAFRSELKSGNLLFVFDGMDEVPVETSLDAVCPYPRHTLISSLADALKEWHNYGCRTLLTSRPYGLDNTQRQMLGLAAVELQPLDRLLQHHFIQRWYQATDAAQPEHEAQSLIDDLGKRRELSHLSSTPLLLTAICVKYREGKTLPEDIHDLFDSIVNQALYSRYPESAPERRLVRARLTAIANGMQQGIPGDEPFDSPQPSIDRSSLLRILSDYLKNSTASEPGFASATEILDELLSNSGLLISSDDDRVQFYHQDFRDFLAAERWHADGNKFSDALASHAESSDWRQLLKFLFARNKHIYSVDKVISDIETLLPDDAPCTDSEVWINQAKLVADCYSIAYGESNQHLHDKRWAKHLRTLCNQARDNNIRAVDRNELWLTLGSLGWDNRIGVGLTSAGMSDIKWEHAKDGQGRPFRISKYLITNAQYQPFLDDPDGFSNDRWWDGIRKTDSKVRSSNWQEPNAPKETVSWYESVAYCRWLSDQLSEPTLRLPTNNEWLCAYVVGQQDFPWNNDTDPQLHANIYESKIRRTSAVGLFPRGSGISGALDMAGNVWEWCLDKYDEDEQESENNLEIDSLDDLRVLRGGSFLHDAFALRASNRYGNHPDHRSLIIGFRVLCGPH